MLDLLSILSDFENEKKTLFKDENISIQLIDYNMLFEEDALEITISIDNETDEDLLLELNSAIINNNKVNIDETQEIINFDKTKNITFIIEKLSENNIDLKKIENIKFNISLCNYNKNKYYLNNEELKYEFYKMDSI